MSVLYVVVFTYKNEKLFYNGRCRSNFHFKTVLDGTVKKFERKTYAQKIIRQIKYGWEERHLNIKWDYKNIEVRKKYNSKDHCKLNYVKFFDGKPRSIPISLLKFNIENHLHINEIPDMMYLDHQGMHGGCWLTLHTSQLYCTECGINLTKIPYYQPANICAFCMLKIGQDANGEISKYLSKDQILDIKRHNILRTIGG